MGMQSFFKSEYSGKANKTIVRFSYWLLSLITMIFITTCGGGGGSGGDSSPEGTEQDVARNITLSIESTVARINMPTALTALITDNNGDPADGVEVLFAITLGSGELSDGASGGSAADESVFEASAADSLSIVTDGNGQAKVSVTSASSGYITIEASTDNGLLMKRSLFITTEDVEFTSDDPFTPIYVVVEADSDFDGVYNEDNDLNICQESENIAVEIRTKTYIMDMLVTEGTTVEDIAYEDITVKVQADVSSLVTFDVSLPQNGCDQATSCLDSSGASASSSPVCTDPCNCVCYDSSGEATGDTPIGDGTYDLAIASYNSSGEGITRLFIDCPDTTLGMNLNILAFTDPVFIDSFDTSYQGNGGLSLYMEPVTITNIDLTADSTTLETSESFTVTARVDTNWGVGTAPDGTIVQFTTDCDGDISSIVETTGGEAVKSFKAPAIVPADGECTVTAEVGDITTSIDITVIDDSVEDVLTVEPSSQTIEDAELGTEYSFVISGGTAPYTAISDNSAVVSVSLTDSTITATLESLPAEDMIVTITIFDSEGDSTIITLNVSGTEDIALDIVPETVIVRGQTGVTSLYGDVEFTIIGGVPPYVISWDIQNNFVDNEASPVVTSSSTFTMQTTIDCPDSTDVESTGTDYDTTITVVDSENSSDTATYSIDCLGETE